MTDMDHLEFYLDNTRNILGKTTAKGNKDIPIFPEWGHVRFFLRKTENAMVFLMEPELRRLHRHFGHPAAHRLHKLKNAGHKVVTTETLDLINKLFHQFQLNSPAPRRFKFTLRDDKEFNYEVIVDVVKLANKNTLHVIDSATGFNAARFLPTMSAKDTINTPRSCWIDVYLGLPDVMTHDASTNFASRECRAEAKMIGIACKQLPTGLLVNWQGRALLPTPLPSFCYPSARAKRDRHEDSLLQMAVKAVKDTAGPDGLVPTLFIYGAYPRVTTDSPPSVGTIRCA